MRINPKWENNEYQHDDIHSASQSTWANVRRKVQRSISHECGAALEVTDLIVGKWVGKNYSMQLPNQYWLINRDNRNLDEAIIDESLKSAQLEGKPLNSLKAIKQFQTIQYQRNLWNWIIFLLLNVRLQPSKVWGLNAMQAMRIWGKRKKSLNTEVSPLILLHRLKKWSGLSYDTSFCTRENTCEIVLNCD
jgi:hypothetical protein